MLQKQNVEVVQYHNTEQDKFLALPEAELLKRQANSYISHTETWVKKPGEIVSSLTI
jgi:hypothetical protein